MRYSFPFLCVSVLCCWEGLWPSAALAQPADPNVAANFQITTNWMGNLSRATDIAFLADGRAVITRRNGTVVVRRANGTTNNNAFTFPNTDSSSEKGLLGVSALRSWREASDGSEAQRTLFFFVSNGPSNADKHRIYKGVLQGDDTLTVDLDNPIVSGGLEGPENHDGGTVQVLGEHLYISTGDTGANHVNPQNKYGSCLNKPLGKILRVNLDGSIPVDNPLVGLNQVTSCTSPTSSWSTATPDTRIYAWGFRNPFRIWVDPKTGLIWAGDVGETEREELSVVRKGDHYGFPFLEGTRANPRDLGNVSSCMQLTPARPCAAPAYEYQRGQNGNRSITGGIIPNEDDRLCGWPDEYKDRYFFGDYESGRVWSVEVNRTEGTVVADSVREFLRPGSVTSFKMGFDDALYVVRHVDSGGSVVKIAPKAREGLTCTGTANMGGEAGGGMGGQGGDGGKGGASGQMGSGGTAGQMSSEGQDGSNGAQDDSNNAEDGGVTDVSGQGGKGGSDDVQPVNDGDESGCGCRLGESSRFSGRALLLMLCVFGLIRWGRRRR